MHTVQEAHQSMDDISNLDVFQAKQHNKTTDYTIHDQNKPTGMIRKDKALAAAKETLRWYSLHQQLCQAVAPIA